jgi:UDP-N-acetylmuramoyl-L-alanyl-D-glutamate--2,6-diaminopimelate ligase
MNCCINRHLSEFFTRQTVVQAGLVERRGDIDPVVTMLEYDSRKVKPGTLYFALHGLHTDGHKYIAEAIKKGASVIVYETETGEKSADVGYLKVKSSRFAMSPIAAAFYGFPSRRLLVAGVTGTEGKTTTVYLIWQLLRLMGKKAGFFSTVQYSDGTVSEKGGEAR